MPTTGLPLEERKPRLLVLASTYPRWSGDPEPGFVHELAKRLGTEFNITVLCPHARGAKSSELMDGVWVKRYRYAPSILETLVNNGGIVTNLRRRWWKWALVPGFLVGGLWSLWQMCRRVRPDVIHAHWLLPQGLAAILLSRMTRMPPLLITSHGGDLFGLNAAPLRSLKCLVARRADALAVVSGAMRDELRRMGIDESAVLVQPMGVDLTERFVPDPNVARSGDEILFVGRMVEKKGLRFLIAAMPTILAERPSAHLTIAGFGPEESERRAQVIALGLEHKVRFVGAVQQAQLPAFYRRAAVFVAPFVEAGHGDQEGLGLVLIEALGSGCPVVTTRLPGVLEIFGHWREFTVEPGNSDQLATQIVRVLKSAAAVEKKEVHELREKLRLRFDWAPVAAAYSRVLRSTMESRRGSGSSPDRAASRVPSK